MKKSVSVAIIVGAVLVLVGALAVFVSFAMSGFDYKLLSTETPIQKTVEIEEGFENITVKVYTSDVTFAVSPDGKCTVKCEEIEGLEHRVSVNDGRLEIIAVDRRKWHERITIASFADRSVTVYLPEGEYKVLTLTTDTGDIHVARGLSFESAVVETDTGDVKWSAETVKNASVETDTGNVLLRGIVVDQLKVTSDTGNVVAEDVTAENGVNVKTDTGNITLTDAKADTVTVGTHTGNVKLKNAVATATLSVTTDTGDVDLTDSDGGSVKVKTNTGDVKGTLLTEKIFFAESDTGSVKVPKTDKGGLCDITTDTGDIKISIK